MELGAALGSARQIHHQQSEKCASASGHPTADRETRRRRGAQQRHSAAEQWRGTEPRLQPTVSNCRPSLLQAADPRTKLPEFAIPVQARKPQSNQETPGKSRSTQLHRLKFFNLTQRCRQQSPHSPERSNNRNPSRPTKVAESQLHSAGSAVGPPGTSKTQRRWSHLQATPHLVTSSSRQPPPIIFTIAVQRPQCTWQWASANRVKSRTARLMGWVACIATSDYCRRRATPRRGRVKATVTRSRDSKQLRATGGFLGRAETCLRIRRTSLLTFVLKSPDRPKAKAPGGGESQILI